MKIRLALLFVMMLQVSAQEMSLSCTGTLIICVPTKDGMVITSDSRSTFAGKFADGIVKVITIPELNAALSITGTAFILPDNISSFRTVEDWISHATPLFQASTVILNKVKTLDSKRIDEKYMNALADDMVLRIIPFVKVRKVPRDGVFCNINIAQHIPEEGISIFASVKILVDQDRIPHSGTVSLRVLKPNDTAEIFLCGEDEYVKTNVVKPEVLGSEFINDYIHSPCKVQERSYAAGATIGYTLVAATAQTAERIPAPSGIGGEIRTFLVDGKSDPCGRKLIRGKDF